MHLCVDPYDNEHEFYGIRRDEKGKIFFCFSSGRTNSERGYPLNITDFAKKLESHRDFPTVTPQTLRENFLTNVKEPLRNSMITKAKVDEKVQKRLNALEQALED
jgi:hypothetical protein